jgi:DNA mismatch repair protein MutS
VELEQLPPMLKQYFEIQKEYPDYFIFMEIGSFFEIMQIGDLGFAKKAAEVADLSLTKKNKNVENSPFMAGFPTHTADSYFKKIVSLGYRIVVVSQVVEQVGNKRVATRKIEKILSPGTVVENLSDEKINYFLSLFEENNAIGAALIDLSTGHVKVTEFEKYNLQDFLSKTKPSEILIYGDILLDENKYKILKVNNNTAITKLINAGKLLGEIYEIRDPTSNPTFAISVLGLDRWRLASISFSNLINYIAATEYNANLLKKIDKPKIYNEIEYLTVPLNGHRSLEIFENQNNNNESLVFALDKCKTAMGKRKLRDWLNFPLIDIGEIEGRYLKVEKYILNQDFYPELINVYDTERLARRMLLSRLMPHEILQFYDSLNLILSINIKENNEVIITKLNKIISYLNSNIDFDRILNHSKDFDFFKGSLIKEVDADLIELKKVRTNALDVKQSYEIIINNAKNNGSIIIEDTNQIEQEESEEEIIFEEEKNTFSSVLKIRKQKDSIKLIGPKSLFKFNEKISMVKRTTSIEVVDKRWKDIAEKLLYKETKYLLAAQKAWEKFQLNFAIVFGEDLSLISESIAEIDVLTNFAKISMERNYFKPKLIDSAHAYFNFKQVRHPVVELSTVLSEKFVANDIILNNDKDILCLYGANSAGKSTILKSVALNIIMAQIGCFISADKGSELVPFEAILTRMTTFDSLSEGLSTFTMEMKELQTSLKYRKKRTLFLFDEIGRGTSVEDGEAIAFATIDYLSHNDNNSVTFFATHYHNLYSNIENYKNVLVKNLDCFVDSRGKIKFSRVLKEGPGDGSYGIDVALSCGLPDDLIRVAKNYNKKYAPLKISRYNKNVHGVICPICNENPVQETHHIVDQKQGKVKKFIVNGKTISINNKDNLIMLCSNCHDKITKKEIILIEK